MTGAQALAERLHVRCVAEWKRFREIDPDRLTTQHGAESHERQAAAILADGSMFLSPAEAERVRRIEEAAGFAYAADNGSHDTMASHDHSRCVAFARDALRVALEGDQP